MGKDDSIMRPIDTIRSRIDSDLAKYHGSNVCLISSDDDIKSIRGIGMVAIVSPLNKLSEGDLDLRSRSANSQNKQENRFPVILTNISEKEFRTDMSQKYYVLINSPVLDRRGMGSGTLISKNLISDVSMIQKVNSIEAVDNTGIPLQNMSREYILGGE